MYHYLINKRCGLLITTLLVLVNIFNSVNATTPSEADGLTSLAHWIVACIVFSFSSLMSYVAILFKMKIPTKIKKQDDQSGKNTFLPEPVKPKLFDLDLKLLVANVLVFILFSVTYWIQILIVVLFAEFIIEYLALTNSQ